MGHWGTSIITRKIDVQFLVNPVLFFLVPCGGEVLIEVIRGLLVNFNRKLLVDVFTSLGLVFTYYFVCGILSGKPAEMLLRFIFLYQR